MSQAPGETKSVNLLEQPFNDYGNAQRLIQMHGRDLRFCPSMKRWLIWDGVRFKLDEKEEIRRVTQQVMLEFCKQAIQSDVASRFAGSSLNSQRISAAIRESQPLLAVSPAELDSDPNLLNFLNGTLDLQTFKLARHQRENLITKVVGYGYNAKARAPEFEKFVDRVLGPLVPFVRKALGYSVTGLTTEKVVFLCYGPTNSGKTTLLEVVRHLFEEYATLILVDSLMTQNEDNNSRADLADLRGCRFAMTSETEEGQRLREGKLKRLTQGQGLVKAVRKYEHPIQFAESHKLWMDTNHKPMIRGTDDAIWGRLVILPFERPLADSEIDRDLPQKLRAQAEGIIAWILEGANLWRKEGLGKIAVVEEIRDQWRTEMDRLAEFLESRCVEGSMMSSASESLYREYRTWSEQVGERPMTNTAFGLRLVEGGFEKRRDSRGRTVYQGIGLKADAESLQVN
jgi:putative DNA primase/helicase